MMPPLRGRWKFIRSVFLITPRRVAITRESPGTNSLTGRMVVTFSSSPNCTRLTMALPWAVGEPMGISCTLQPEDPALVGEHQEKAVGGGDVELGDEIVFPGDHADAALAAPALAAVDGQGGALDVVPVADGHHHLFVGDEVFGGELLGLGTISVRRPSP